MGSNSVYEMGIIEDCKDSKLFDILTWMRDRVDVGRPRLDHMRW